MTSIILFVLGFIFLLKGADLLVKGASSIAARYGISSLVIGLTVVAFGTSAPELVVSSVAAVKGSAEIALGNIIGSNISNILLILGLAAVIRPLLVKKSTIDKEIPFTLLSTMAVVVLVNDFLIDGLRPDGLTRIDGLILILFFSIFIYYTFGISREKENFLEKTVEDIRNEGPREYHISRSFLMMIVGLVGLYFGGEWIVNGAVSFAAFFGMSETLIALTIIAVGTSLPELAASGMAAYRGKTDMAVGNIIGSNIFNLLWVLGLSSIIRPISYTTALNTDFIFLFAITALLMLLIYVGKKNVIGRMEGVVLIGLYFLYLIFLILRG